MCLSTASTESRLAKVDSPMLDEPRSGLTQRSMFQTTWSATNSSPLCQSTPWRRWKVQVLRSSDASQLSASIGRVTLSGPVIARYSAMCRVWLDICVHE